MPPVRVVLVAHDRGIGEEKAMFSESRWKRIRQRVPMCAGDRRPTHQDDERDCRAPNVFQTALLHMCAEVNESATGQPD